MNLILFGFKKSGKTYLGLKVAAEMRMHFLDTDQMVEELFTARYHKVLSSKQIVTHHGMHLFRELEKQVIFSLKGIDNTVIALGGGSILDKDNLDHLTKTGTLVYIKTDKETLKKRMLSGEIPSYIDPVDPIGSFEELYKHRIPFYEKVPAFSVDTSARSESQVMQILCDLVESVRASYGQQ